MSASVLVVDDDAAVLELTREYLRRAGHASRCAEGGREAITLFSQKSSDIDVVVLDLSMPDMDGREVLRELRRIRTDIPVVLATGYDPSSLEQSLRSEPHLGFLRKPYEPEQLLAAIQAVRRPAPR